MRAFFQHQKHPHPSPLPEGEGTERCDWAKHAGLGYRVECKYAQDQKPLTLALSRRERGLTEVFRRNTLT